MIEHPIVIIGAGISGLAAANVLARQGRKVVVVEAREEAGGLASSLEAGGLRFDAGPYILLDRPGLEWAFEQMSIDLRSTLELVALDPVYSVQLAGREISVERDLTSTAEQFEAAEAGAAKKYLRFVQETGEIYSRLLPLRFLSRPSGLDVVRWGRWKGFRFLCSSLDGVLTQYELPYVARNVLSIWSHIAGQTAAGAPSPLALVPAMLHSVGAFYPRGGMGEIARALARSAEKSGVEFRFGEAVRRIVTEGRRIRRIETACGEIVPAFVISACGALSTYLELLDFELPSKFLSWLRRLPLQSPGVMAYVRTRGGGSRYLRFLLDDHGCSAAVFPGALERAGDGGWRPMRLIRPLPHGEARPFGKTAAEHLEHLLRSEWWQGGISGSELVAEHTPASWEKEYHLFEGSMNPAMTASFMRRGRFPRRCPYVENLFFTGSSTHPGQWVSFCAVSGVLTARAVLEVPS